MCRCRKLEKRKIGPCGHYKHPQSVLWDAKVSCVNEPPGDLILRLITDGALMLTNAPVMLPPILVVARLNRGTLQLPQDIFKKWLEIFPE
jgi:hypothetical protein